MTSNIMLLDCTLRDGAYVVNSMFGDAVIRGLISKLQEARIEIIECGWLKNEHHKDGSTFFQTPNDIKQYITPKKNHITYTAMIDWNKYDVEKLPYNNNSSIDGIRVVFPYGKYMEGISVGKKISQKGYKLFFQAANTLAYSDKDLISLANEMNSVMPVSISIVDTFGAMYDEDLIRIASILDKYLSKQIAIGFHSHNNQQLSFALTMNFVKMFANKQRKIIVDSTLCGMGRGAGNATTELVANYLNQKFYHHYDMDTIMDAIDIYMGYFQEKFKWGYSTPYFIAGIYCCHVNNIAYLVNNHRATTKDIRNIICSMKLEDRQKYDYNLLEKNYLKVVSRQVDDSKEKQLLQNSLKNKEILLMAPGKSILSNEKHIKAYITKHKPIIIGINAILPNYRYDYLFFVNTARYEYSKISYKKQFNSTKHILLSNIKTDKNDNEIIINYDHATKAGWKHFDNAVICCLRMLDWLEIKEVKIAGFDGFKNVYNDSYADPYLPTLNPENNWDELNEEIKLIFEDFKLNANFCKNINAITESYFIKN